MIKERDFSRRTFLKVMGGVGASFTLGSFALGCTSEAVAKGASNAKNGGAVFTPNVFMKIDPDGAVTVTAIRSEMGQGVRTSMAMLVADELDADWTKVKVVQAQGDDSKYGSMGTGGSSSTRSTYQQLREMGAAGRMMLLAAAAKQWGVEPAACRTENGHVIHDETKRTIAYGDLTSAASQVAVPTDVKVKHPSQFRIVGKPTARIDNPNIVTGKAIFGQDVQVEGAKYAVISRAPAFHAKLISFDDSAAKAVPGVQQVFKVGSGVAVVADNTWAAIKGRDALKTNWDTSENAGVSTATLEAALRGAVVAAPPPKGNFSNDASTMGVSATYDLPYLAHATMEPMNAVAHVQGDHCTIWAPTQSPDGARNGVARMLGIPAENVEFNTTLLGGGFGRRGNTDYVFEAVEISRTAKAPIKLFWTREDDTRHDFYRPMSHHALTGVIDANGNALTWAHQFIQAGRERDGGFEQASIPYSIGSAVDREAGVKSPVPNGAWRSVSYAPYIFATETFIDEMAHAARKDPYEFRKAMVSDKRVLAVMETAAQKAGWGTPLPAGHARGMAIFNGYNSPICHVVELSVEGDKIKLHRVVAAVDPGLVINPRGVEGQIQSGTCDGLSAALRALITIEKGGVKQQTFWDYEWMTFDAMPPVEVYILSNNHEPGGIGEVGVPSTAPAVANAVFAATGKRVRRLPIKISELV